MKVLRASRRSKSISEAGGAKKARFSRDIYRIHRPYRRALFHHGGAYSVTQSRVPVNPRKTVGAIIRAPLTVHGIGDAKDRRGEVERMMALVGLPILARGSESRWRRWLPTPIPRKKFSLFLRPAHPKFGVLLQNLILKSSSDPQDTLVRSNDYNA